MAEGTPNTQSTLSAGNDLPPAMVKDTASILAGLDDEILYDLLQINPPRPASTTNVNVAWLARDEDKPLVTGSASLARVTVNPCKVIRSATDNTNVRRLCSALVSQATNVAMPTGPSAGQWGFELLYAQIAYVNANDPAQGTQVTLAFAPSPTYVAVASKPNFAALPANTSSPPTWNVPLKYVRFVGGMTGVPQQAIIDVPPGIISGNTAQIRRRLGEKVAGESARRAFAGGFVQDPREMTVGGRSPLVGGTQQITSTVMPALVGRSDADKIDLEILIPLDWSEQTNGALSTFVVDDSRDWRGANFKTFWSIGAIAGGSFAEDIDYSGTIDILAPGMISTNDTAGAILCMSSGQSWNAFTPTTHVASGLWAALVGGEVKNLGINGGQAITAYLVTANHDIWGLVVDASTGALKFACQRSGTVGVNGVPIWIELTAVFGNHR